MRRFSSCFVALTAAVLARQAAPTLAVGSIEQSGSVRHQTF
jgi:hypothetical protein